eukprot:6213990-Alexandrium_andersonii.AAC.1
MQLCGRPPHAHTHGTEHPQGCRSLGSKVPRTFLARSPCPLARQAKRPSLGLGICKHRSPP